MLRLAVEGGFNAVVLQIGLAEKFFWEYAGEVPLILKLNGKTDIPPDDAALSSLHATVEDAVRLGADAVGYTLYVGTPAYARDFASTGPSVQDAAAARHAADRLGLPARVRSGGQGRERLVLRGRLRRPDRGRGGRRHGQGELPEPEKQDDVHRSTRATFSDQQAIDAVVRSAGRTMLLVSGGARPVTRP